MGHVLSAAGDVTLGEYLARWLATQRTQLQPSTLRAYRAKIELYLVPTLGDLGLDELEPMLIEEAYAHLVEQGGYRGKPLSIRTVRYAHAVLHKALADAVDRGLLATNPASGVRPPRVDPRQETVDDEMRVWSPGELRAFLDHVADHPWRPLWRMAAATGMRRGELLGLRWVDVDLAGSCLRVRRALSVVDGVARLKRTKTLRPRTVGIDEQTVGALAERRERQRAARERAGEAWSDRWGLVFTEADGSHLDPLRVSIAFRRLVRAAPVPVIRLHDLRHVHASLLLARGVPIKVVSRRVGHAKVSMTLEIYAHCLPAADEEAVACFAALLDDRDADRRTEPGSGSEARGATQDDVGE